VQLKFSSYRMYVRNLGSVPFDHVAINHSHSQQPVLRSTFHCSSAVTNGQLQRGQTGATPEALMDYYNRLSCKL